MFVGFPFLIYSLFLCHTNDYERLYVTNAKVKCYTDGVVFVVHRFFYFFFSSPCILSASLIRKHRAGETFRYVKQKTHFLASLSTRNALPDVERAKGWSSVELMGCVSSRIAAGGGSPLFVIKMTFVFFC